MNSQLKTLMVFIGDAVMFITSLYLALLVRYNFIGGQDVNFLNEQFVKHLPHFLVVFAIFIIVFYLNGLYDLRLANDFRLLRRTSINSLGIGILLAILYFYLNVSSEIAPKTNLAIFFVVFTLLFIFWRHLAFDWIRTIATSNKIAIIGGGPRADKLIRELQANPGPGYACAVVIRELDELDTLAAKIREHEIRSIVLINDFDNNAKLRNLLFSLLPEKISFFTYPDFYETLTGKIPIEAINQDWFLDNLREGDKNYYEFSKRLIELCVSAFILIISLPLWPLIALAVKFNSEGPVLFKQQRLGRQSQTFTIFKFRTMTTHNNNQSPTAINDQRITKVGRFLRATRLDELPQMFNIFSGEMSFIGPRPERPEIVGELETAIPFYRTRLLVKPGLTGWDQVSGQYHSPSIEDSLEKLQYDLFYIKNRSLSLDSLILMKTVSTVLGRRGR